MRSDETGAGGGRLEDSDGFGEKKPARKVRATRVDANISATGAFAAGSGSGSGGTTFAFASTSTRNVAVTWPAAFASAIIAITSIMVLPSQLVPLTSWIGAPTGTEAAAEVSCTRSTTTLPSPLGMRPMPRGAPLGKVMRFSTVMKVRAGGNGNGGGSSGALVAISMSPALALSPTPAADDDGFETTGGSGRAASEEEAVGSSFPFLPTVSALAARGLSSHARPPL